MPSLLILAAMLAAPPVPNVEPGSASGPKPKWVVFYADNYCVLIRPRSGSAGGLRIESRPYETVHELQFILPRDGRGNYVRPGLLSVARTPQAIANSMSVYESPSSADRRVKTGISKAELAIAAKEQSLGVTIPNWIDERVSTAGMGKALLAVKTCEEDLAARWGTPRTWSIDPVPMVNLQTVFRVSDYPTGLLNAGVRGDSRPLLRIGTSGEVLTCRSITPNELKQLANLVCDILRKRAKFTPARDSAGNPVESYYVTPRVRFMLVN